MTFIQGCIAIILYLLSLFAFLQGHIILGAIAVVLYSIKFGAVTVLPMAVLLDGYFGAFHQVPIFSLIAIGWYLLSELLRSVMNIVQSEHE